jgi:hypothetical protein
MKLIRFWKNKRKIGKHLTDVPNDEVDVDSGIENGDQITATPLRPSA